MSERLERIKESWKEREGVRGHIEGLDIDWLIEQAERVEELGALSSNEWVDVVGKFERYVALREALEFYADEENWIGVITSIGNFPGKVEKDQGDKARQALGGE